MQTPLLEFKDKLSNILLEGVGGVSSDEVIDAINNRYRVLINYDDEEPNPPTGQRLIEPYVYGLTTAGNEAIRAFQYYGATRRGVPKYKLFRLDRILNWNPQPDNHFYADPKKLAVVAPDYNENGDGSMTMIFAQVKFGGKKEVSNDELNQGEWQSPLERIRKEKEIQKQDIEQQINNQPDKEGAIKTKSLERELDNNKSELEKNLDNSTSNVKRGAVKVNQNVYDRDNKTPQEKHDDEIMRRRDRRWEKAADSRPLYRKSSTNYDLRTDLNKSLGITDDNEE